MYVLDIINVRWSSAQMVHHLAWDCVDMIGAAATSYKVTVTQELHAAPGPPVTLRFYCHTAAVPAYQSTSATRQ